MYLPFDKKGPQRGSPREQEDHMVQVCIVSKADGAEEDKLVAPTKVTWQIQKVWPNRKFQLLPNKAQLH